MIKIIKLISGEEIVGDVSVLEVNEIQVDKPCLIQLVPSRTGDMPSIGVFPYAMYTEKHRITLKEEVIVWQEEPIKELYNQYNSIFGSGLVVPT